MEDLLPVAIIVIFCISCFLRIWIEKIVENGSEQEKTLKDIYSIVIIVQYGCACFFGLKLVEIIFK